MMFRDIDVELDREMKISRYDRLLTDSNFFHHSAQNAIKTGEPVYMGMYMGQDIFISAKLVEEKVNICHLCGERAKTKPFDACDLCNSKYIGETTGHSKGEVEKL